MGFWELVRRPKTSHLAGFEFLDDYGEIVAQPQSAFLQLPAEIIDQILSHLQCPSLVSLSRCSKQLAFHTANDLLWASLLRAQLPPADFPRTPYPSDSYRSLYISHHPYWHLPRYKIWFSDDAHTGKLILIKFDGRRGCIEGYRLVADRGEPNFIPWSFNPEVIIHTFDPKPSLWLGDPVLKLEREPTFANSRQGWWDGEIKMKIGAAGHNIFSSFFLSRDIAEQRLDKSMELWPPMTIPGMPRVRNASHDNFQGWGHKPQKVEEISTTTFRLRKWTQFSMGGSAFGIRMGDEVSTWSTLHPELYTPTEQKPYQGIFVGDYSGHGCEFLLVMQTDKAPPPPRPNTDSRFYRTLQANAFANNVSLGSTRETRHHADAQSTYAEDDVYHGAIEAVKLTGDPNIPRGEHTFIADDIGAAGFIRVAQETPFRGARVVRSRAHVAARGFRDDEDEFVPSQLIMISHDKLAQYWVPLGHISFYERVDIDRLLASCSECAE